MSNVEVKTGYLNELKITSFQSVNDAVCYILAGGDLRREFAIAINAEKIVSALSHVSVMSVLKEGTLLYADGISVVWAMKQKGVFGRRVTGCDLWRSLMFESVSYKAPVYIVGASLEVNTSVVEKLKDIGVNIVGAQDGYFYDESLVFSNIRLAEPKIVSVAMGSPAQEIFISRCRKIWPDAFYMGVGGTYDVFIGKVRRAPVWMQRCNLEWAFRLIIQPTRIFRQANLFKFLWLYLTKRL